MVTLHDRFTCLVFGFSDNNPDDNTGEKNLYWSFISEEGWGLGGFLFYLFSSDLDLKYSRIDTGTN